MTEQVVGDLKALARDMDGYRDGDVALPPAKLNEWVMVLRYATAQLELPACPECGEPMAFSAELQALACGRHTDE